MLAYKAKDSNWPSSTPAWPLLEELYLDYGEDWDTLFRDVELNHYLPNLKTFFLTNYSMNLLPGTKFNRTTHFLNAGSLKINSIDSSSSTQ